MFIIISNFIRKKNCFSLSAYFLMAYMIELFIKAFDILLIWLLLVVYSVACSIHYRNNKNKSWLQCYFFHCYEKTPDITQGEIYFNLQF